MRVAGFTLAHRHSGIGLPMACGVASLTGTLAQIPYDVAQSLFVDAWKEFGRDDRKLPLTEPQFCRALSGENMVASARPVGGPQRSEALRMLAAERARIQADRAWLTATRGKLDAAAKARDAGVAALLTVR